MEISYSRAHTAEINIAKYTAPLRPKIFHNGPFLSEGKPQTSRKGFNLSLTNIVGVK